MKLQSLTTEKGQRLNGATAVLGKYDFNTERYEVNVNGSVKSVKVTNTFKVPEQWLREVRGSPMRGRLSEMTAKFHAPGFSPCTLSDLRQPYMTQAVLESWWGSGVFPHIRERMESQRLRPGWMNWCMDEAMKDGRILLASVYSDGGRQSQMEARTIGGQVGRMHWPTIIFPLPNGQFGSYCQGLALQDGASAWAAHPDNLIIFGPYEHAAPPRAQMESTVQIEELAEDDDSDSASSWERV